MFAPSYVTSILQFKPQRILREAVSSALSEFQLSITEWSMLGQIYTDKDGIRLAELAFSIGVEAPLITNLIERLEKKELVEKRAHPYDRRAKLLFLTKNCKNLIPVIEEKVQAKLYGVLSGLSESDLSIYKNVLETIIRNEPK